MKKISYFILIILVQFTSCTKEFDDLGASKKIIGKWKVTSYEIKKTTNGKIEYDYVVNCNKDSLSQYWTFSNDNVLYRTYFESIDNDTTTFYITNGKLQFNGEFLNPPMTINKITDNLLVLYQNSQNNANYSDERYLNLEKIILK